MIGACHSLQLRLCPQAPHPVSYTLELSWIVPLRSFPRGLSQSHPQPSEPCSPLLLPPSAWTRWTTILRKKENHAAIMTASAYTPTSQIKWSPVPTSKAACFFLLGMRVESQCNLICISWMGKDAVLFKKYLSATSVVTYAFTPSRRYRRQRRAEHCKFHASQDYIDPVPKPK